MSVSDQAEPLAPLLIYIHGFLSSPLSAKAEETRRFIEQHNLAIDFTAPMLSNFPGQAFEQLRDFIEQQGVRQLALIGSSLGGFYATTLAERFDIPAVLVNPAVNPARNRFHVYLGAQHNPYSGEDFVLTEQHQQQLADMEVAKLSQPKKLWLMVQTADEVLDYRQAVEFYATCPQLIEEGGDHRFQNFPQHLPAVFKFLQLPLS